MAGPVSTKIAPPTNPAIPIIITSTKPNERTKCCSCGCDGVSSLYDVGKYLSILFNVIWDKAIKGLEGVR
jgi:hypothetical protein